MKHLKDLFYIILGNTLIAWAACDLLIQNKIIVGGVSGLGVIAQSYLGISIPITVGIANIFLFIAGFLAFGKEFSVKTVISTFYFPVAIGIFQSYHTVLTQINDLFVVSVMAGCFIGLGVGMILKTESSTGGVDILALLLNKYFHQPISTMMRIIDLGIVLLQIPLYNINNIVYGIISILSISYILNKTLTSGHELAQIMIMSEKLEELREMILFKQDAGLTLLQSQTGYMRQASNVILTVVPYRKLTEIKNRVNELDPDAFVIVSNVNEVGGQGFTKNRRY
ncbi:MAG: YitT family protein [Phascolarctobacterium sp.]|nr:YitT family protein [Phascolarctobacterium sp.]